jgi:hypothetical protein
MATNEVYKYGQWISLPLPLRGNDPQKNLDPTRNGDPVLIGDIVGVAQEVGGVPSVVDTGTVVTMFKRNTANSLEPGWASVALCGAWAIPVDGFDPAAHGAGTAVGIVAATEQEAAKLVIGAGDHPFGHLIGWTKMPVKKDDGTPQAPKQMAGNCYATPPKQPKELVPIVNIVQTVTGAVNDVPDKPAGS